MINYKDVVKKERAKERAKAPGTGEPGNGKTPEELIEGIIEAREAQETIKAKAAKEKAAKEAEAEKVKASELEEHYVEPPKNPNEICPFCGEEKTVRGMSRHIKAIHGVPGVSLDDINNVERGEKTPADLATEKGVTEIFDLSPEIDKKYFSSWDDIEDPDDIENLEDPEIQEDPEDLKDTEKEAGENGRIGLLPILFIIGIPVALVLSRIPKFKEISDKLFAILGDLGSNKSSDPRKSSSTNFSSHWGNRRF